MHASVKHALLTYVRPADVEEGVALFAVQCRLVPGMRIEASREVERAHPARGMALKELRAECRGFFRQALKQRRGGLGRDVGPAKHDDRVGIRLRLIVARVAQRDDLLGISAEIAGEQADERADPELAQQGFGDMAPADVRDFVREHSASASASVSVIAGLNTTM